MRSSNLIPNKVPVYQARRNVVVCINDTSGTHYDTNVKKMESVLEGYLVPSVRQAILSVSCGFGYEKGMENQHSTSSEQSK